MEARIDGQGHHQKARPYEPHYKNGLVKVVSLVPLSKLCLGNDDDVLPESVVVEMGCSEPKMWYVDTVGCGKLQANPANPPPRNGFVHKAMRYAAVLILSLMVVVGASSCQKEPKPTPTPQPTPDTITPVNPVNPGDTITPVTPVTPTDTVKLSVKINNATGADILYPSVDTVKKLLAMNKVVMIRWKVPLACTSGWTPSQFHTPRDTLKKLFKLSPYVIGAEKIYVNKNYGGASIPCEDSLTISKLGMTVCDSTIFVGWGYRPTRGRETRENHINFIDTLGMKRSAQP